MPELFFDDLSAVPEVFRDIAKEAEDDKGAKTGKVSINVVPNSKLQEFRETNVRISQDLDKLKAEYEKLVPIVGEKPDEFAEQLEELRRIKKRVDDGELVAGTDLETALNKRTKEMKADLEGKNNALGQDRDEWRKKWEAADSKYKRTVISTQVVDAIMDKDVGALTDARSDILNRAMSVFKIDDQDQLRAFDSDGNVIYGPDGATPMTPKDWLIGLKDSAPYFFQQSRGGGAGGGPGVPSTGKLTAQQIGSLSQDEYAKARKEGRIG